MAQHRLESQGAGIAPLTTKDNAMFEDMTEFLNGLFALVSERNASDLLITAGAPPMVRIDGDLLPAADSPLTPDQTRKLLLSLITEEQTKRFELNKELDFSLNTEQLEGRFRVNYYMQRGCMAGAFRAISNIIPTFETLNLPPVIKELCHRQQGLILITGPTGHGKSTTQAAMLHEINQTRKCHIVTIEDPIEFVHKNAKSVVDQREIGSDTRDFATALKYVLRQDPDVLLVGEMRDLETISSALTAAETGHLVISTLHTNDTVQSVDRIIDVYPPHQQQQIRIQLGFCLVSVVAQQLIPLADGEGRIPAVEVLVNNPAVANLIRDNKTPQIYSILQTHARDGMIHQEEYIKKLYREGAITLEAAQARVRDPRSL